jgi:hypothetical protein
VKNLAGVQCSGPLFSEKKLVRVLEVTRRECEDLLGKFLDDSHYDILIEEDTDVYLKDPLSPVENGEHNVVLMFRKNFFTKEQQAGAYEGLMQAAKPTQNRGLAAGPKGVKCQGRDWATTEQLDILNFLSKLGDRATFNQEDIDRIKSIAKNKKDTRGMVWLGEEKARLNFDFNRWLDSRLHDSLVDGVPGSQIRNDASWVLNNLISDTTYANPVDSGIAGWFDRYPRIPYGRATSYTAHNFERFKLSWPFMKQLSKGFKELLPYRWNVQMAMTSQIDPSFHIPKTPFTTITVNKNFRTAAHRDAGDLAAGFSNLTVVAKDNDYSGAYLVLPEVRAAVNIRPGDLLLVANHDYIHGNTPIISKAGVELERISLVCYFREAMLELGSRAYEDLRYDFVEYRRKDPSNPLAREGWNGVSAGMWDGEEFRLFAESTDRTDVWKEYHSKEESSLESLFG